MRSGLSRSIDRLLQTCRDLGIAFVAYSPRAEWVEENANAVAVDLPPKTARNSTQSRRTSRASAIPKAGCARSTADAYWMGVPPDGAEVSLPAAPMALPACQMVPVVLVKKCRVPVLAVSGSAQA